MLHSVAVMTKKIHLQISHRDTEILQAVDRTPLTPNQLFKLSSTFERPFGSDQNLRRRLRQLVDANLLRSFPYAIATNGRSPAYYRLTPNGYRTIYGVDSPMPKRRRFEALSDAHHHHSNALAELVVHFSCAASRNGGQIVNFTPENSVCIEAQPFRLFPDCTFQLVTPSKRYNFVVELDNGSERVRSKVDTESIERKIRGYDLHQSQWDATASDRYVVLFVTTRTRTRLDHMMSAAFELVSNPDRTLFLGCDLASVLKSPRPFKEKVWVDPKNRSRSLTYSKNPPKKNSSTLLTSTAQVC